MEVSSAIEAILFYKNEPTSITFLAKTLKKSESEIDEALNQLENSLNGRGVSLMRIGNEVRLATSNIFSELISNLVKEELSSELGRAGLETLSIILYLGPISRSRIDNIRGVNSSFIIRNLLVRGLIDRSIDEKDSRSYIYRPSFDLLAHLGVTRVEELPSFDKVREEIINFETPKVADPENTETNL